TPSELYTLSLHDALPICQGFQKIKWQVSSSAHGFMLRNMAATGGPVESVQIDLAVNRIVFQKGEMEDREFQQFLRSLLDAFFIRSEEHTSELQSRENLVC